MPAPSSPQRIVVFRALMLGDLLCAIPALRALRQAFPAAQLALAALPWTRALAERLDCIDVFLPFPGHPQLPESLVPLEVTDRFVAEVAARRFDLALQMHGSGSIVNPLVERFEARQTAAFIEPGAGAPPGALVLPWPVRGHEIDRCLALTDRIGAPRRGRHLDWPMRADDREAARALAGSARYAIVHPGAQLPSRRWPPERFADVAAALADAGLDVLVTGTEPEASLVDGVVGAAAERQRTGRVRSVAGRTDLWTLGALVADAALVVCNDTGLSHVAAAVRTPSVVVASGSDVERWRPLDDRRHRVLWEPVACRPCAWRTCPIGHPCALAIPSRRVAETALELLEQTWPDRCES